MLQKKDGFPAEGEIVLCTVTNIQYNSVFVKLDEYKNAQGMIHISEISPGRIRNLRDFVKEGKVIVCKILKVHKDRGHIDLSLRRVNENQRRNKLEEIKRAQKADKIAELCAKELKIDVKEFSKILARAISNNFDNLYASFEAVVEEDFDLATLGLEKNLVEVLDSQIRQKIKPISVKIEGTLTLTSFESNGMELIKAALMKAEEVSEQINLYYEGGGHFRIEVTAPEYKEAEKILHDALEILEQQVLKDGGEYKFDRIEHKK
ncbi:hypothetical protein BVX95_01455 [archaeon D22]|nr:hypothetical protein BVX95_01455 [archaeon D22]